MIRAMEKIEGMSQFVDGFLEHTGQECILCMHGGKPLFQSKCGYDAGFSIELCLTVNIGQDRNEEVHVGNGKDFNR
jgi:hypothetical protein